MISFWDWPLKKVIIVGNFIGNDPKICKLKISKLVDFLKFDYLLLLYNDMPIYPH